MVAGKLKIHTENILPIIKKWLYTEREIFLRELVSNACDALTKARRLRDANEATFDDDTLRIDISLDKQAKTLTIADTGIGMSAEEVEKYIAQVAFSSAEEFVEKYTNSNTQETIIGHFGLGFFSAYMVADKVTIDTLSIRPESSPVLWECDGSVDYTLSGGARTERGTSITLHLAGDALEYLEETHLRTLLTNYCAYLPYPIYLGEHRINDKEPLWLSSPSKTDDKEYLTFYRDLHPFDPDPIFWIHLNIDYPFHLQGILYFPKVTTRVDWSKSHIKLFSNRVFVSDNCKDILPDYLTMLRGAIDSPDIPLNVSRSSLQVDATVRKLTAHIASKVASRLTALHQSDPKKYQEIWPDIELIVKLGAIQDDKFYEKVKPALIFKTLSGDTLTIDDYLEKTPSDKIFYTSDERLPDQLLDLYKNKNIDILLATSPVDTALISHLEQKHAGKTFQRLDGALDDSLLDPTKENTLLDSDGKTKASQIATFVKETLSIDTLDVEAKSLASDTLPSLLILDENMRRLRDHMALTGQDIPHSLSAKKTLVLNTNSPLVHALHTLKDSDPALARDLTHQLYDLSLLSQREFDPAALTTFITRTTTLLERLTTK